MSTQQALQNGTQEHTSPKLAIYLLVPTDPTVATGTCYHYNGGMSQEHHRVGHI